MTTASVSTVGRERRGPRPWIRPPTLRTTTVERDGGRRASWLELFFDLVFVVAIAVLAQQFVRDHSLEGFGVFAGLYLPVFIAWQGFTVYADRFDTDDVLFRAVMLGVMLAIAALAVQVPDVAAGDGDGGFVLAYAIVRGLLVALYLRARRHVPEARPLIDRYSAGYSAGVAIWLGSLLLPTPGRYVAWGFALCLEYAMPWIARPLHARIPIDTSHLPERFGLFTIIALGESIVAVALGTAGTDWRLTSAATAAFGFVAVACLWWAYFDRGPEEDLPPVTGAILIFAYAHIPLIAALTLVGAGVHLLIEESLEGHTSAGAAWALNGGAAAYLACVAVARRSMAGRIERRFVVAKGVTITALLALAAAGSALEPVVLIGGSAAALLLLVLYEIRAALAVPTG